MSLKNISRALKYKLIYPTSKIYSDSFISKNSNLGLNVLIGKNSNIDISSIGNNSCICGPDNNISNSTIGNETNIYSNSNIFQSQLENNNAIYKGCNISNSFIGRFSYITENSTINSSTIGSFCSIGPQLICGYGEHPTEFISTHPVFFSTQKQCGVSFASQDCFEESQRISIGHDVWIGARVFIKDGINIGSGVIVAAGAVVTKNIPDYAIVGGIPAKIIRFRFSPEIIEELLNIKWWEWPEEVLKLAQSYFNTKDYSTVYGFLPKRVI